VHERFFLDQMKLAPDQLDLLAESALEAYEAVHSPEFSYVRFRQKIGKDLTAHLKKAGVIQVVDAGTAQFDHQLRQDYLAARQIARHRDRWVAGSFDALTFEGASNQTLDLVVDQLGSEDEGDAFIRAVYDWSWRAATRCVTEAARHAPRVCSREIEVAITCLVAEKQFDPVHHTRLNSQASLKGFPAGLGQEIAKLASREDVWRFPQRIDSSSGWFNEWRNMFAGAVNPDTLVAAIAGSQSLVGWTAASVIRRQAYAALVGELVGAYARSPNAPAVRWRVVHALGRFDEASAVDLLVRAVLNDVDEWVKYGAGRSLVEIAVTTRDQVRRQKIIAALIDGMRMFPDKVIEEIAGTARFAGAESTWA
jgi:hypothetical protein